MKKISVAFILIVVLTFSLLIMTSCGENISDSEGIEVVLRMGEDDKGQIAVINSQSELPDPQKEGYEFKGWFLDKDFQMPLKNDSLKTIKKDGAIALFAQFEPVNFNIEYQLNGGVNNVQNVFTYTIHDDITLYEPTKNVEGLEYEFKGWYDNRMFTGEKITQIPRGSVGDKTFYALWTPYDIVYHLNGGVNDAANPLVYDGSQDIVLNNPVKVGYTFEGWFDNAEFNGEPVSVIPAGSSRDREFFAKWTLRSYQITYQLDGGQNHEENPLSYHINMSAELYEAYKRGYLFMGWYDNAELQGDEVISIEEGTFGDMTLYAAWQPIEYEINYILYGGENPSNPSYYTIEDEIILDPAIRAGYDFTGWYDAFNNLVEKIERGSDWTVTLYARWQPIAYGINYILDGGDNHLANPNTYTVESSIQLRPAQKNGYIFKGWYDNADYEGDEIISLPLAEPREVNLYAKFLIAYEILYYLNGGEFTDSVIQQFTEEDSFVLPIPTKGGYDFEGWYDNADYEGDKIIEIERTAQDILVYAKYTPITYGVTYHYNGGEFVENPQTYTIEDDIVLNIPQKDGYDFTGWYLNDELTGESVQKLGGRIGDLELYAAWSPAEYDINYVVNGDFAYYNPNPQTYTIEDEVVFQVPSIIGYRFDKWYADSEMSVPIELIPEGTTGDITVYGAFYKLYPITYIIEEGGFNHPANPTEFTILDEIELNPASKNGYRFMGWYSNGDFVGDKVQVIKERQEPITLYAKFLVEYSIIYNYNQHEGGENHPENPATIVSEESVVLHDPVRNGYLFLGWYDSDLYLNQITVLPEGTTSSVAVYAKWEIIVYTINYGLDGGENHSINPDTYTVNDSVSLMSPTKDGYLFTGWFYDQEFSIGPISTIPRGSTGNIDVYARFLKIYSIEYDPNGGINSEFNPIAYTVDDELVLYPAERTGYDFVGWEYNGEIIDTISGLAGNILLKAVWDITHYVITYNTYGGTVLDPLSYTILDEIIFVGAEKEHYVFDGWYFDPDFEGEAVEKIEAGSVGDIELYAKYSLFEYPIVYHLNGGKNNENNPQTYNITDEIVFRAPQKNEFKFLGWYEEPEYENFIAGIGVGSYGELHIYARWEIKTYSIIYNSLFDGENHPNNPSTYTTEDEFEFLPAQREEYMFGGWYLVDTAGMSDQQLKALNIHPVSEVKKNTVGNIILFARWLSDTYEIEYVLESGAVNNQNNPYSYTRDDRVVFYPATKSQYTFIGWYDNPDYVGEPIWELPKGTFGNKTFYARFSFTYYVTYQLYGGTYAQAVETYTVLSDNIELGVPIKPGFIFKGWYTNSSFTGDIQTHIITSDAEDKVYHARFLQEFEIFYVLYSGFNHEDNPLVCTEEDSFELKDAYRPNYIFMGWYESPAFSGEPITYVPSGVSQNLTFYAKFLFRNELNYFLNGGVNHPLNPSYFTEEDEITLLEPAREGYSFEGWYNNINFIGTPITQVGSDSSGIRNLYAKWQIVEYTITYFLNGGYPSGNPNPNSYNIDTGGIQLLDAQKDYYQFVGWYDNAEFMGQKITNIPPNSTGDMTLYAKWQPIVYTITYMNVSEGENHIDNPDSFTVESPEIVFQAPTKQGAIFENWYNNAAFSGSPITALPAGSSGDRIYYAKWTFIPYHIVYHLDAGTQNHPANPNTYTVEEIVTLGAPIKGYHTFLGWYRNPAFTGDVIETTQGLIGNIDLYARFAPTYYINYHLNGGINHLENPNSFTEFSDTIVLKDPSKDYYIFDGWYEQSDFGERIYDIPTGTKTDIHIYAKWQPIVYNIAYHLNGGEPASNPVTYTFETDNIFLQAPIRDGYEFGGWYLSPDFEGTPIAAITIGSHGDIELYAQWTLIDYLINYYNLLDGVNSPLNPASYNAQTGLVELYAAERDDYDFMGWYDNQMFEGEPMEHIESSLLADIDLYAKWTPTEYLIVYHLFGGTNHIDNPETYNVENVYELYNPQREHFVFLNWYANQYFTGEPLTRIENRSGTLNLYAKWQAIEFNIVYNFGDGKNHLDNPLKYTVEDQVVLKPATKANYNFMGWYLNPEFEGEPIAVIDGWGDIELFAKFLFSYKITYHLNGGENALNPSSYTVEDYIILEDAQKPSHIFTGWYDNPELEGEPITVITGEGDIELYAGFERVYTITYELNGGQNHPDNPSYFTEEMEIELGPPVRSGYIFMGWYLSPDFSGEPIRIISGRQENLTLYAWWGEWGHYMSYGEYPQTLLEDDAIIDALNNGLGDITEQGYYSYLGKEYAKVIADKNVNGYIIGQTYYFIVEPIKWRIVNNENGILTLVSDLILDAKSFHSEYQTDWQIVDGKLNNWAESDIRVWLNSEFYSQAFYSNDYYILEQATSQSDNPIYNISSMGAGGDKVRLLSIEDVTNYGYGFVEDLYALDQNRVAKNSDYALINGAYADGDNNGAWWLYTPGSNKRYTSFVGPDGIVYANGNNMTLSSYGVRAAIVIDARGRD